MSNPKCGVCGRFIKLTDIDARNIYDHSGIVDTLFYHKKCLTTPLMSSKDKATAFFGLQPHHITQIVQRRDMWMINSSGNFEPLYADAFWEQLGQEFSWHPLTLCLHYFKLKHKYTTTND